MKKAVISILIFFALVMMISCTGESEMNSFKMKARVDNIGDRIEVTVIDAEYAEGIYWLVVGDLTEYKDEDNSIIEKSDISIGDIVEITYNGQVMMSYPPQIAALEIKILPNRSIEPVV